MRYGHKGVLTPALLVTVSAVLGGCGQQVRGPDLALLVGSGPYLYSDRDWEVVLRTYVRQGLVDYSALSANRVALDRYYALLSVTGPSRTPAQFDSRAHKIAYWVNAYNALVLHAVLERYPISTMYDLSLPRLEHDYRFTVDGRSVTLADIEAEVLSVSGNDCRALLAMSRAAMGGPGLPSVPIRAEVLDQQLAEIAARALDDPHILRIDHARDEILVWQLVLCRRSEFEDSWRRLHRAYSARLFDVLEGMASPERRQELQEAVGYSICQMPFDRMLNRAGAELPRPVVP